MATESSGFAHSSFDLKSTPMTVVAVVLKSTDCTHLVRDLATRLGDDPDFFNNDPVLIDLVAVRDDPQPIDFPALLQELRKYHTLPVAVRGGSVTQMQAAHDCGLIAAPEIPRAPPTPSVAREVVREVVREVPVEVIREILVPGPGTMVVDKPLRSGQRVYARDADLVVLAMVSFGAEVIADGNIHVYAPLRGRAIAGARGDEDARIFSTCLEPQLVSIAGIYRTIETTLPAEVHGKPAQVRLEGEKLFFDPL